MVFFASNLGYRQAQHRVAPIGYGDEAARERAAAADVGRDLRRALGSELADRLRVLHFRRLGRTSAERILHLGLEGMARRYREVHGMGLELTPAGREEIGTTAAARASGRSCWSGCGSCARPVSVPATRISGGARLDYDTVRVHFAGGRFVHEAVRRGERA